jgi:acyl-CoA reductase-like NAD-dependent aldehyde dehydrogenase
MENMDEITSAHEADRVFPSKFNGVGGMILHGLAAYAELVDEFVKPVPLRDCSPAMLRAGVEADYYFVHEPKGVCINISPWNAPVQLSLIPVMAMLAAGNHAVIKPPDMVPAVSALLRRLCQKYLHGFVWVEEGGREAVERLVDEGADHLVFTGGGQIAKSVAARCAQQLTPVSLELGGKSPVFVDAGLSDALIADAVREVLQLKVVKTGQFCCAHDYLLVHEAVYDSFVAQLTAELVALEEKRNVHVIGRRVYEDLKTKFTAAAARSKCVPPMVGPCVFNDENMSIPMTCLLEPPLDCELMTQEIFGPLLPILKVKDVAEAIDHVKARPSGKPLIAYCYTNNPEVADAFIAGTQSGNVAVNSGPQRLLANTDVAFGGVGNSGHGVSLWGRECMHEFTNRRHIIRAKNGFAKSFFSGPPPAAK